MPWPMRRSRRSSSRSGSSGSRAGAGPKHFNSAMVFPFNRGAVPAPMASGRKCQEMKYHRYCSDAISPFTGERFGIFVAVWHLIRDRKVGEEEEAEYWRHRAWFEEKLPLPPFHPDGDPRRAITGFNDRAMSHPTAPPHSTAGNWRQNPLDADLTRNEADTSDCPASDRCGSEPRPAVEG